MELRREVLTTEILDPRRDFAPTELTVEIRWDPLTGHTSRILPSAGLLQPAKFDLSELAEQTRAGCPFCTERIEQTTPKLPPSVAQAGRIRRGEAVLFPNLLPYSRHSSVSVYSPERHFLPLGEMSAELIADNLATQVEFACAVRRADEEAIWASVNANHMLPAGSSVFHPHLQGSVNPTPTTFYDELGFTSFNMAIYGAPPATRGYPLNLRLVARSTLEPLYRSDATWLERLHWEAAVDVAPEALADAAGSRFSG